MRRKIQDEILDRFNGTCLSYTLNIPGSVKDSAAFRAAFRKGLDQLNIAVGNRILYAYIRFLRTGPEAFFSIELAPEELKKRTVEIEESHPCGRLFDMDVLAVRGNPVSREELGLPRRKCLICDNPAPLCARNRTHSLGELLERIDSITGNI
ncbi:citrate lyase holo-[acyl-carrier protein] synthase [Spirochaeta isovalerica]|uniref:citrate lyase holo-[acyl-carrier protein] synthase n=1 Tax=Spirochaeta isovalerica TaxID=150 RepID=A0A841R3Q2_9SPIO|nr:citrate lyase holo-[acyl-carrier protein] synthase [Spirochaeta isovalerica]MBB6478505.1 holo-ACP synthase [Spirochaeta isovalerica]